MFPSSNGPEPVEQPQQGHRDDMAQRPAPASSPELVPPEPEQGARQLCRHELAMIGWGLFAFLLASQLSAYALSELALAFLPGIYSTWTLLSLNAVCTYGFGFGALYLFVRRLDPSDHAYRRTRRMGPGKVFVCFCIGYAAAFSCNLLSNFLIGILAEQRGRAITNRLSDLLTLSDSLPALVLFIVILGPVMEELIFRRLLLDRLRKYGDTFAILSSSLAFSLFHANLSQLLFSFVLGMIFAYIALTTGRIIHTIALHIMINGTSILSYAAFTQQNELGTLLIGLFILICVILGVPYFLIARKHIELSPSHLPLHTGQKAFALFVNPGLIAFVVSVAVLIAYSNF